MNLPDTIEKIADRAFYYCDIESIVLPKSLREIGDHAFYDCGLEKVYYRGSEAEWGSIDIGDDYAIRNALIICNFQGEETTDQTQAGNELWLCPECGFNATGKFCSNCGTARQTGDQSADQAEEAA